jgi:hypothetical protein
MPQDGFEPTIPVTKRPKPTPYTARSPEQAMTEISLRYKEENVIDENVIMKFHYNMVIR